MCVCHYRMDREGPISSYIFCPQVRGFGVNVYGLIASINNWNFQTC